MHVPGRPPEQSQQYLLGFIFCDAAASLPAMYVIIAAAGKGRAEQG